MLAPSASLGPLDHEMLVGGIDLAEGVRLEVQLAQPLVQGCHVVQLERLGKKFRGQIRNFIQIHSFSRSNLYGTSEVLATSDPPAQAERAQT